MKYNTIIGLISKHLADELVSESEMLDYMDRVVDDINTRLNATFPTFTEFKEQNKDIDPILLDYTPIPDKYIRSVVIPGAAFKYYTTDEEGNYAAPKYAEEYELGLFYMVRDFSFSIPAEYQADEQGYVDMQGFNEGLNIPVQRGGIF